MADRWEQYRVGGGPDRWERYRVADIPGTTPRVPAQERAVTLGERAILQTVAPHDPAAKAEWLKGRGYQATPTPAGQVAVMKKDGSGWGVIDEQGPELMDLVDAADEIAFGVGAGVGGAATAGAGLPGLLASGKGAAIGSAAVEGVRQALGQAAGFDRTPAEVLTDVAVTGAVGGVAEPLFRGAGRLLKGAGRKILFRGKEAAPEQPAGFIGRGDRVKEASLEPAQEPIPPRPGVPETVDEVLRPPPADVAPAGRPGRPMEPQAPPAAVAPESRPGPPMDADIPDPLRRLSQRDLPEEMPLFPQEPRSYLDRLAEEFGETPGDVLRAVDPDAWARIHKEPRGFLDPEARLQPVEPPVGGGKEPALREWTEEMAPQVSRLGGSTRRIPNEEMAERMYGALRAEREPSEAFMRLQEIGVGGDEAAAMVTELPPPAVAPKAKSDIRFRPTKAPQFERYGKGPGQRGMRPSKDMPPIYGGLGDEPRQPSIRLSEDAEYIDVYDADGNFFARLNQTREGHKRAEELLDKLGRTKPGRAPGTGALPEPAERGGFGTAGEDEVRPLVRQAIDDIIERVDQGKLDIDTMSRIVGIARGRPTYQEMLELTSRMGQSLDQGVEARVIDEMRVGEWWDWLRNLGWGEKLIAKGRAGMPRAAAPTTKAPRGLVTPTDELGPSGANVVESSPGRTAVRWRGTDIGGFGDPELSGNLAHYLNEVLRQDVGPYGLNTRIMAGIEDTLRRGGYGEADIRGFESWLRQQLLESVMDAGTRVKVEPYGYGRLGSADLTERWPRGPGGVRENYWKIYLDGEDLGGDFSDEVGLQAAKELQELLEEIVSAPGAGGRPSKHLIAARLRSMRGRIRDILDEANHYSDEADEFLEVLEGNFDSFPVEVTTGWDDGAQGYYVDADGIHLGMFDDATDADDMAAAANDLINEYNTGSRSVDYELDKLRQMGEYSQEFQGGDDAFLDDAIVELDDHVRPEEPYFWRKQITTQAKHYGPGEIMGGARATLKVQADGTIMVDDFAIAMPPGASPQGQFRHGKVLSVLKKIIDRRTWTFREFDELDDALQAAGVPSADAYNTMARLQKYLKDKYGPLGRNISGGVGEPAERLSAQEAEGLAPLGKEQVEKLISERPKGARVVLTIKKKDGSLRSMEVGDRPPQMDPAAIKEQAAELTDQQLREMVQELGVPKAPKPIAEKYGTTNPGELPREGLLEWLYESQPAVVTGRGKPSKGLRVWEKASGYGLPKKHERRPMAIAAEKGGYRAPGEVLQVEVEAGGKVTRHRSTGTSEGPAIEPKYKEHPRQTSVSGRLRRRRRGEKTPPKPTGVETSTPRALEKLGAPVKRPGPEIPETPEPGYQRGAKEIPGAFEQEPQPEFRWGEATRKAAGRAAKGAASAAEAYVTAGKGPAFRFLWRLATDLAKKYTPNLYQSASETVKRALASIQRIMETAGMQSALAAAYSLIQGNPEFKQWLEQQQKGGALAE